VVGEEFLVGQEGYHLVFHLVVQMDVGLFHMQLLCVFGHFLEEPADDLVVLKVPQQFFLHFWVVAVLLFDFVLLV
jgi:hypothetical protein